MERWNGGRFPETSTAGYILCHPGLRAGIQSQGWQSPFATETGGLFQTGNSVASAEQTSAALKLSASICVNQKQAAAHTPSPETASPEKNIDTNLYGYIQDGSSKRLNMAVAVAITLACCKIRRRTSINAVPRKELKCKHILQ